MNYTLNYLAMILFFVLMVKLWMIAANYVGEHFRLGKLVVGIFHKLGNS